MAASMSMNNTNTNEMYMGIKQQNAILFLIYTLHNLLHLTHWPLGDVAAMSNV